MSWFKRCLIWDWGVGEFDPQRKDIGLTKGKCPGFEILYTRMDLVRDIEELFRTVWNIDAFVKVIDDIWRKRRRNKKRNERLPFDIEIFLIY